MRIYGIIIVVLGIFSSCYPTSISFRDNSIDPNLKTFSVINFELAAPNAPVSYPITFTEFLKDGILANTKLKLLKSGDADCHLIFSGEVTDYLIQPVSIQGDNVAAQNRLTIGLRIEIENTLDPDKSIEFRPRRFADYNSDQDINAIESQLLAEINEQLLQDILNKLQSDW
jgi:hypothetical protein